MNADTMQFKCLSTSARHDAFQP